MATKTAAKLQISMSFRDAGYERGLKKARQDTRRTQSAIQKFTPSLGKLGAAAGAAGVAMGAVFAGRKLFQAGKAAVGLFAEQEKAVTGLEAALQATGKAGAASLKLITDEASRIQRVTTAADESLIAATGTLAQLAPALNADELARAQRAIVGVADTFLKGNIENAALLIGKSIGSTTNALSRYGIKIDTAASQSEKLKQLIEATAVAFGVSQAKATAFSGQIEQLKNFFGDMGEEIGRNLVPPLREFSTFLLDNRDTMEEFARAFAGQLGRITDEVRGFAAAASVDMGAAFEALGGVLGHRLGQGILKSLEVWFREINLLAKIPGIGGLFDQINVAAGSFDRLADRAGAAADRAAVRLANLAAVGDNWREIAQGMATDATGIAAAIAVAGRESENLTAATGALDDAGGGLTAAADLVRAPRPAPIAAPAPPVLTGPALELLTGPKLTFPPLDVTELDTGTVRMEKLLDDFGKNATQDMRAIGVDLVQGLASGTLDAGDILKKAVLRLASSFILGPLTGFLGIFSPSKVTRGFGQDIGRGLAIGIDSMRPVVATASQQLALAAVPVLPTIPPPVRGDGGEAALARMHEERQAPPSFAVNAMFDAHRTALSAGGQVFVREAYRHLRNQGMRD